MMFSWLSKWCKGNKNTPKTNQWSFEPESLLGSEFYHYFFENCSEGLIWINPLTQSIIHINKAASTLIGRDIDQCRGRQLPDVIPSHWQQIFIRMHKKLSMADQNADLPTLFGTDGRDYQLILSRCAKYDIPVIQLHFRPMTQSPDYSDSPALLELSAIEHLKEMFYTIQLDGTFTYMSPACEKILGYPPKKILGTKWQDYTHPDDIDKCLRSIQSLLDGVGKDEMELRAKHADGRWVWLHYTCSVVRDGRGNPRYFIGASQDITARKIAEERSIEALRFLELLIDTIPNPVFYQDAQGVYLGCNQAFADLMGAKKTDIVGHTVYGFTSTSSEFCFRDPQDLFNGPQKQVYETPVKTKEGNKHDMMVYEAVFNCLQTKKRGIVGVMIDITQHKNAEKQNQKTAMLAEQSRAELLELNARLEQSIERANLLAQEATVATQAKSEFIANVSHELRTPMNAIIGFSELLKHETMPDNQREYVSMIYDAGKLLLTLVNDVLDFSKIESGQLELHYEHIRVDTILHNLDAMIRQKAKAKKIDFTITADKELPKHIYTDPRRLEQCLHNLLDNAVKFTETGSVSLTVAHANIDQKDHWVWQITDTGIGIEKDKQQTIFDTFSQADTSSSRKYGGAGMGLTITDQIVRMMNGFITLQSQPGKGSAFIITLPDIAPDIAQPLPPANKKSITTSDYQTSPPQKTTSPQNQLPQLKGRALIVTAGMAEQKILAGMAQKILLDYTILDNAENAVKVAMDQHFDVILIDIHVQGMSALEMIQMLRWLGVKTYTIALLSEQCAGNISSFIDAGCDRTLQKPYQISDLANAIEDVLTQMKKSYHVHQISPNDSDSPRNALENQLDKIQKLADKMLITHDQLQIVSLQQLLEQVKQKTHRDNFLDLYHTAARAEQFLIEGQMQDFHDQIKQLQAFCQN